MQFSHFQAAFPRAIEAAGAGEGQPGPWRAQQFLYFCPELQGHGVFRGGGEANAASAACPSVSHGSGVLQFEPNLISADLA